MEVPVSTSDNSLSEIPTHDDLLIVGLGASAGGIEALMRFFENVTAESGLAYVVILHLSPDHDSQLASVLQNVSQIPVTQVTHQVRIEPDHVYVIPPNAHLEMVGSSMIVSPNMRTEDRRAPVDIFFRTLAESHQARAIAVVLSGTGANGSMGLKRVKERGGAVFVQNPREADFNEMPRNAIATDLVDEVLPVAQIPERILSYKQSLGKVQIPVEPHKRPDDQQKALREIFTQLRLRTGHDFSNYKRPTILRRIERRVNVRRLPHLPAYATYLSDNPDEAQSLLKDLLISVTNFFRDKKAFETLETEILPRVLAEKSAEEQVRVWVPGCATGEEAYSLAILLAERTIGILDAPKVQVFATDIDEEAISKAREGLYTLNDAADISPERLRRFFTKEEDSYRVRSEIREMILFANHNALKDPPFSRIDLVSCRNMLIYLNGTAQERLMETFHFALNPGGYLFLGSAESVDGSTDLYAPVNREQHIYQSRQVGSRMYPPPEMSGTLRLTAPRQEAPAHVERPERPVPQQRISYGELHQQLLEQYAPPSLVVNEAFDIVHLSERAGRYLQVAAGEPSTNLLKLIHPELRLELRTALYQAVQRGTNVEARNLQFRQGEQTQNLSIHVRPVLRQTDTARGFLLVVFEPTEDTEDGSETIFTSDEPVAHQIEEELMRVKDQLRSASEQYETQAEELKSSNEELQAMNEELRSAAEELETSKEELQSINEELRTVNQELKVKIEEATHTSNNFQNLINSTEIGTIFLDRSLRVNLFTPATRTIFNLIPADYGRPLSDITHRLQYDHLLADAERVLETLQPIEREVETDDGRSFTMRLLPYRTAEDRINGLVVTFVDITERKQVDEAKLFLAAIVESSQDSIMTVDFEGVITSWNQAAEALYGFSAKEAIRQPISMLTLPAGLREVVSQIDSIKNSLQVLTFDTIRVHKDGHELILEVVMSPVKDSGGEVIGVSTIARDITQRKQAEVALRESEEQRQLVLESVEDYTILTATPQGSITSWNRGAEKAFGWSADEIIGQSLDILFTPEDRQNGVPEQERQTAFSQGRAEDERFHLRKDGSLFYLSGVTTPIQSGDTSGLVKIARDMTQELQAETELRESEARFRTLSDAVPQIIWTNMTDGTANYFNQRWFDYTGLSYETSFGPGWLSIVHPDDATASIVRWQHALRQGEVFETEYRLRRFDGAYRWHIGRNVPIHDEKGHVISWFGTATDIEELKQAEAKLQGAHEELEQRVRERTQELAQALEQVKAEVIQRREAEAARAALVKRVVNTQEEERGRISRELHDNLGQHLTGVMLGLQALENQITSIIGGQRQQNTPQLEILRQQVDGLMQAAHRQAWELRPAELDAMGVEAALEQYIRDWSKRTNIPVDFQAIGWEEQRLDWAIETTLYRVVQEALTNVTRHAQATQVSVVLELSGNTASAIIEDNGQGFDPEQIKGRLGVLGMRERLSIVNGTLDIESALGEGTTVFGRIVLQAPVQHNEPAGRATETEQPEVPPSNAPE